MKVLFIGVGNMATSLIKGIQNSKEKIEIFANHYNEDKLSEYCHLNKVNKFYDLSELNKITFDVIVICVLPKQAENILNKLDSFKLDQTLIASIVSGMNVETIKKCFSNNYKINILRIMPNLNSEISKSINGYVASTNSEISLNNGLRLFKLTGETIQIKEEDFSIFTAIAGCSPAYTYLFMKALIDISIQNNIDYDNSKKIVGNMLIGSGEMLLKSNDKPDQLIKKICVPGGITEKGLNSLIDNNFENIIQDCISIILNTKKHG